MNKYKELGRQVELKAAEARQICEAAKAAGRGFTPSELTTVNRLVDEMDSLKTERKQIQEGIAQGQAVWDSLRALGGPGVYGPDGSYHEGLGSLAGGAKGGRRVLNLKSATHQFATKGGQPVGIKALVADGGSVADLSFAPDPISLGKPLDQVMDVLNLQVTGRDYSYLRQTVRTMNAAPVADGALKPESPMALERVEGRLKVVAHLSEPINKFWLEDNAALNDWISSELVYGISLALSDQVLHGDGTGENFTGFDATSGVQTQAYDTNLLITTRKAINALETAGYVPHGFIIHPNDWLTIETATTANGGYLFGGAGAPVERVTRQLWGVPVVVSNQVTAGEGWLVGEGAATLMMAGAAGDATGDAAQPRISAEWGTQADDFGRNQLRARVEGRFDLAVAQPGAIVKIATAESAG